MRNILVVSILSLTLMATGACKDEAKNSGAETSSKGKQNASSSGASSAKLFVKSDLRTKEICSEVLGLAATSKALGIDLSDHEASTPMKGMCSIGTGRSQYRLSFHLSDVSDSIENAKFRFQNMTKDATPEEVKAAMKMVTNKAEEMRPDGIKEGNVASEVIASNAPTTTHTLVANIGDEAKLQKQSMRGEVDYNVVVRVRNAIFRVSAGGKALDDEGEKVTSEKLAGVVSSVINAL